MTSTEYSLPTDYEATMGELEADRTEMMDLIKQCSRKTVQKELEFWVLEIEEQIEKRKVKGAPPVPLDKDDKAAIKDLAAEKQRREALSSGDVPASKGGVFKEITTFALEVGGYDSPTVAVDVRLKGVEALPAENVTCDFGECSFDLKVHGLDGENYRMKKTNLEKDIVPSESSVRVKKNHVVVTLKKVKGDYGYESWSDLTGKRRKAENKKSSADDPQASIMSMMKDLYDDGDDSMKKIIGEAMYKARSGEKQDTKDGTTEFLKDSFSDMDMGSE